MARRSQEDLFEKTTMTFGEHLEELRVCVVRALIGLVIGFLIGLLVANYVVRWIESPLIKALTKHYAESAKAQLQSMYAGEVPEGLEKFVVQEGLIYQEFFVEQRELERWSRLGAAPDEATGGEGQAAAGRGEQDGPSVTELPPPDPRLVKTRLWRPARARLTSLSPHESFMIWLKAGFVAGLVIASPYMFYQLWLFVAAGLYPHEKKFVYIYLPFSIGLFIAGAALAFFFVFGPVLDFLFSFSRSLHIDPDLRISEVISFVLFLPLGFGVAFQLPLVMLFLNRIHIFTTEAYLSKWRLAVLVIFIISMFLTPADPVSMLLMALPLTGLYFLGVGLCVWMPRSRNPFTDQEAYDPS